MTAPTDEPDLPGPPASLPDTTLADLRRIVSAALAEHAARRPTDEGGGPPEGAP